MESLKPEVVKDAKTGRTPSNKLIALGDRVVDVNGVRVFHLRNGELHCG